MTTFATFWQRFVSRTPALADEEAIVTIKSREFRKVLAAAYRAGKRDLAADANAVCDGIEHRGERDALDLLERFLRKRSQ